MNEMSFYVERNGATFLTQSMAHPKLCISYSHAISLLSIESCPKNVFTCVLHYTVLTQLKAKLLCTEALNPICAFVFHGSSQ